MVVYTFPGNYDRSNLCTKKVYSILYTFLNEIHQEYNSAKNDKGLE